MNDCLIPARGGSKGIPNKNIIKINDLPLIAYTIIVAKQCNFIDRVFVSTDSEEIAKIAEFYGANIPFLRPSYLATDYVNDKEVFKHFLNEANSLGLNISENIVHLRATTPSREYKLIDKAIKAFANTDKFTSLRSAHKAKEVPFKWYRLEGGVFKSLLTATNNVDIQNMPRQQFPQSFIPNGYVDIVNTSTILDENLFHGDNIQAFITEKANDIDDFVDLEEAKKDENLKKISVNFTK